MNISLPDKMREMVEAEVESGLYSNASDFFRDVLRDRFAASERLVAALEAGEASGISHRSPREIFDSILMRPQ